MAGFIEPIGKHLINGCASCPVRHSERRINASELPQLPRLHIGFLPLLKQPERAGISGDPEEALALILESAPKYTDYLVCSGVRGLNVIGTGIDVEILRRCSRAKVLKGSLNYYVSLLISLIRFSLYRFTTERDDRKGRHNGLIVCACNGKQFGGGIAICPDAVCDDGVMNIVLVQDVRKSMVPGALLKLMGGKILRQPYTLHEHAKRLKVEFEQPAPLQIDGEIYEDLPFDVQVISGELKMYRA